MADRIGLGIILLVNDGANSAFTELLYVLPGSLTPPAVENEFTPDEYLNQATRVHTTKPGMKNAGEFSFQVKMDDTELARLRALADRDETDTCPQFRIDYGTPTHTFSAWVKSAKVDPIPIGDIVTVTVQCKLNSDVTVA